MIVDHAYYYTDLESIFDPYFPTRTGEVCLTPVTANTGTQTLYRITGVDNQGRLTYHGSATVRNIGGGYFVSSGYNTNNSYINPVSFTCYDPSVFAGLEVQVYYPLISFFIFLIIIYIIYRVFIKRLMP